MIERLYAGESAVVAATGPGLTEAVVDKVMAYADRYRLFGLNDTYRIFPYLDVHYACDGRWWKKHIPEMRKQKFYAAEGWWTQEKTAAQEFPELRLIKGVNKEGLSRRQDTIHFGQNSGYQLINLAYLFGIRRMILVGYNMQRVDGVAHFFGEHPQGLVRSSNYRNFCQRYDTINPREYGIKIINATENTCLNSFPKASLDEALQEVADDSFRIDRRAKEIAAGSRGSR